MKKIYLTPRMESYQIHMKDGLLISASTDVTSLLDDGGDTDEDIITSGDTKYGGDWGAIWE